MTIDYSGEWNSSYRYESGGEAHESNHTILLHHDGGPVVYGESVPQEEGRSLVLFSLEIAGEHGRELRGQWEETTDAQGPYAGRLFDGLLHLMLNEAGDELRGVWTGANRSGAIKTGEWVLQRAINDTIKA